MKPEARLCRGSVIGPIRYKFDLRNSASAEEQESPSPSGYLALLPPRSGIPHGHPGITSGSRIYRGTSNSKVTTGMRLLLTPALLLLHWLLLPFLLPSRCCCCCCCCCCGMDQCLRPQNALFTHAHMCPPLQPPTACTSTQPTAVEPSHRYEPLQYYCICVHRIVIASCDQAEFDI